jgi:hypothetical protein
MPYVGFEPTDSASKRPMPTPQIARPLRPNPGEKTTGIHWIGGWMDLRTSQDTDARGKILFPPAGDRTPIARSLVRHYTN